ncbi:MAG: DNA methyltransferase [Candidatus Woesearchaeota archaeon]
MGLEFIFPENKTRNILLLCHMSEEHLYIKCLSLNKKKMVITRNEIRKRAVEFSHEWKDETRERAEAQTFWNQFFNVFGIDRRRYVKFDEPSKKIDGNGYIDVFWKGKLVAEHKSAGKDLSKAYGQALDYFVGLSDEELPKYVIVTDFKKFRLYNELDGTHKEFDISNLIDNIALFDFISGHERIIYENEDPVNIKAAQLMGKLHDSLKDNGYSGHNLEIFLVRLMFCLFADDTDIFETNRFREFVETKTSVDGSDTGQNIITLFEVLNTDEDKRQKNLDEGLAIFPYIDGSLFSERIPIPAFDSETRSFLLECCHFDWSRVSPAVFGSLFQSVMNQDERHDLGGHYTTEKNVLKTINALFLDGLISEFESHKNNKRYLEIMLQNIGNIKIFDPACGCGNFLMIAYRELRRLQVKIHLRLRKLKGHSHQRVLNIVFDNDLNVDSMFGIEILEFPARIAQVGLWLTDHLVNRELSKEFGLYYKRLPLKKTANIIIGNALRLDWETIIPKREPIFILGNPPFISRKNRNEEQKTDMDLVCGSINNYKLLDYVSCWYIKTAEYIKDTNIKVGLVSTNSITQGEQVGILWDFLMTTKSVKINFAHRTFTWCSDARWKAHVHVVIIGFSIIEDKNKYIYDYEDPNSEPVKIKANNINSYLIDQKNMFIFDRNKPLCNVPEMSFGNMPLDGGHLLLSDEEKKEFLLKEPSALSYIKPLISAREYLNGEKRWCLWLVDANPSELRVMPEVLKRIQMVKEFRLKSEAPSTRKFAATPTLFRDRQQPERYILIPSTTSETRSYIPIGFFGKNDIANNSCHLIPDGNLFHFGMLTSEMHMAWVKSVCGRMKSDYRYSKDLVYNNYPWPENVPVDKSKQVEKAAEFVLTIRKKYKSSLADLYGPLTMPKDLLQAHQKLNKSVDKCYRNKPFKSDLERVEYLFELYDKYISNNQKKI